MAGAFTGFAAVRVVTEVESDADLEAIRAAYEYSRGCSTVGEVFERATPVSHSLSLNGEILD